MNEVNNRFACLTVYGYPTHSLCRSLEWHNSNAFLRENKQLLSHWCIIVTFYWLFCCTFYCLNSFFFIFTCDLWATHSSSQDLPSLILWSTEEERPWKCLHCASFVSTGSLVCLTVPVTQAQFIKHCVQ